MADIEKVIQGLERCLKHTCPAIYSKEYEECEYTVGLYCGQDKLLHEALKLLKEQQLKWIPVSEGLPEEHDSIFAKLKGTDKWRSAMFEKSSDDVRVVEVFEDGTRRVYHSHTIDGKWDIEKQPMKRTVTHWMPNPELPLEGR